MSESSRYLIEKYPDLVGSKPVEKAVSRRIASGEGGSRTKTERVDTYLARLQAIAKKKSGETRTQNNTGIEIAPDKEDETDLEHHFTDGEERMPKNQRREQPNEPPERDAQYLKDMILREYVLDTSDKATVATLARKLYESEKRILIEQGRGTEVGSMNLSEAQIIEKYTPLIQEKADIQRKTLLDWLNYLEQNDAGYPMWFQYLTIRELGKMGSRKDDTIGYEKRSSKTIAPFPEHNAEALGWVKQRIETGDIEPEWYVPRTTEVAEHKDILVKALKAKDFVTLYALAQLETAGRLNKESIEGEWKKYNKGSSPTTLENDVKGKGTGWCTAEGSAASHLQSGDFYVYYTKTDSGYTQPRIAIRMEGDTVAEVRGVNKRQGLEPELVDIAQSKYKELPGGDKYDKKSTDMKQVTELVKKQDKKVPFTKADLVFLYELDSPIEGFAYDSKDDRVTKLRDTRKQAGLLEQDQATVFDCEPSQIAHSQEDFMKNAVAGIETKAYIGPLFKDIFKTFGYLEHIYVSFPEKRMRHETISIGGKTARKLIQELENEKSESATFILKSKDFVTAAEPEQIHLLRLKVSDLGFTKNPTTDELYQKIQELGLELCPAEVGPHYRLQYQDQPLNEFLYVGMKQITDSDGNPNVFCLDRGDGGRWLHGVWAEPKGQWNSDGEFVFRLRK